MRHRAGAARETLDLRPQARRFSAPAGSGGLLPKQHRSQTALGCTGRKPVPGSQEKDVPFASQQRHR